VVGGERVGMAMVVRDDWMVGAGSEGGLRGEIGLEG